MPEHENIITFQAPERGRLAILIGAAPKGKIQTKVHDMVNFLTSDAGGTWAEEDIMILPYGCDPKELDELIAFYAAPKMFYYLCPVYAKPFVQTKNLKINEFKQRWNQ